MRRAPTRVVVWAVVALTMKRDTRLTTLGGRAAALAEARETLQRESGELLEDFQEEQDQEDASDLASGRYRAPTGTLWRFVESGRFAPFGESITARVNIVADRWDELSAAVLKVLQSFEFVVE